MSNLHLVDKHQDSAPIRVFDVLQSWTRADEGMVKYKGRAKGKVHMPKTPVKVVYGAAPVVVICVSFKSVTVEPQTQSVERRKG